MSFRGGQIYSLSSVQNNGQKHVINFLLCRATRCHRAPNEGAAKLLIFGRRAVGVGVRSSRVFRASNQQFFSLLGAASHSSERFHR